MVTSVIRLVEHNLVLCSNRSADDPLVLEYVTNLDTKEELSFLNSVTRSLEDIDGNSTPLTSDISLLKLKYLRPNMVK